MVCERVERVLFVCVNLVGSCRKNEGGARLGIELQGDVDATRRPLFWRPQLCKRKTMLLPRAVRLDYSQILHCFQRGLSLGRIPIPGVSVCCRCMHVCGVMT